MLINPCKPVQKRASSDITCGSVQVCDDLIRRPVGEVYFAYSKSTGKTGSLGQNQHNTCWYNRGHEKNVSLKRPKHQEEITAGGYVEGSKGKGTHANEDWKRLREM